MEFSYFVALILSVQFCVDIYRAVGVVWGRFWRSGVWTGVPLLGHNSGLVGLSDHFYRIGVICLFYILQSSCVWDPAIS